MSKKRVAYFYDEDVGNFHYGGYLNWKLGNLRLLLNLHDSMDQDVLRILSILLLEDIL